MRVIPPLEITDARLTSSTATEPHAPAAYNPATTYAADTIALVAADFQRYESLVAGNLGNTPSTSPTKWREIGYTETAYSTGTTYALGDTASSAHRVYMSLAAGNLNNPLPVLPETTTTKWLDVGPTNRWAMFDLKRNTQTVFASPLTVVLTPEDRVDSIGLDGLDATSVTVSMVVSAVTVYSRTVALSTRDVANWYQFFFAAFKTKQALALFDLPPYYTGAVITVAITNTGGNARCGALVVGMWKYLGNAEENAGLRLVQYSVIERDAFGNATLIPRASIPTTEQRLKVDAALVKAITNVLIALDAVPAFYSVLDDADHILFEPMLVCGIYRDVDWTIADPVCFLRLKIEGI